MPLANNFLRLKRAYLLPCFLAAEFQFLIVFLFSNRGLLSLDSAIVGVRVARIKGIRSRKVKRDNRTFQLVVELVQKREVVISVICFEVLA